MSGRARYLAVCVLSWVTASALAGTLTTVDPDAHYPEGPLWRDGKLWYVEYATSNIKSWDGAHIATYWHHDGCGPSALMPFNGHLLIACYDDNSLVELDASGKESAPCAPTAVASRSSVPTTSPPMATAASTSVPPACTTSRRPSPARWCT